MRRGAARWSAGEPLTDGGGPFAVYHSLYWLTVNPSADPLALLVDDLQWSDPPSLAAIEYVARRLEGLPVLLVLASRPHEPGFDRSILDALGREPPARAVAPSALSQAATAPATDRHCPPWTPPLPG